MLKIILYSVLLIVVTYTIKFLFPHLVHQQVWALLLFLTGLTLLSHLATQFFISKNKELFVLVFLGTMVFRLLTSFIFIAFYAFNHLPDLFIFVSDFIILYLLYTGFEIYILLSTLRPNLKSRDKP